MAKKHILVLASTFPQSNTDKVPAFVRDQIISLKKLYPNLQFTVLAPHTAYSKMKNFKETEFYDEYRFHYFWPWSLEKLTGRGILPQLKSNPIYYFLVPFLFFGEFYAARKLVEKIKPNFIYAHWFTPQGIIASMVGKFLDLPVVLTTHASDVAVWRNIPFGGYIVRSHLQNVKAITAVSRRTLEKMRYFFSDLQWREMSPKTKIIPMGINLNHFPGEIGTVVRHRIMFIGRLSEKKGVQFLLPAFKEILEFYPSATLTVAGDGPMLIALQRQSRDLGLSKNHVFFPGYIRGENKFKLLTSGDIFVVPSIETDGGDTEGLPVSLMEGLAAGCICIATNESGADEIIKNGINGFLVPQKNIEALVFYIKKAFSLNDEERYRLRCSAMQSAHQFSWDKIAKEHYEFFFDDVRNSGS